MRNIKTVRTIEVHPSAEELALCFWSMWSEEQAEFFNALGRVAKERLYFQLQAVTDHKCLDADGRMAMAMIGDYAQPAAREEQGAGHE